MSCLPMAAARQANRDDLHFAVVCALRREFDAVTGVLDSHDATRALLGQEPADDNVYTIGRIGQNQVVLLCLPQSGKASSAVATVKLRSSFPRLKLVLLVGICGGVPRPQTDREILLGDVVFAKHIVQYDLGSRGHDGFRTYDAEKNLGPAPTGVRNLLELFQTNDHFDALQKRTASALEKLQSSSRALMYKYPGAVQDKLFPANYMHKHRGLATCSECMASATACKSSRVDKCAAVGCEVSQVIPRRRLDSLAPEISVAMPPRIIFGRMGSGDTVVKSGDYRDELAEEHNLDAFEMEGAGLWNELPCVIIKSVCDYADSHKNDDWQDYAAATAASAAAAVLQCLQPADESASPPKSLQGATGKFFVPNLGRNGAFIERKSIMDWLLDRLPPHKAPDDCQQTALVGLGGIGKTQLALEAAFQVRDLYPDCSIFWVPAVDRISAENAYREVGRLLRVPVDDADMTNVPALVHAALGRNENTPWLLIVDNADDRDLLFGDSGILKNPPFHRNGSVLITTRNDELTAELAIPKDNVFKVDAMKRSEATKLLHSGLDERQKGTTMDCDALLDFLDKLPLAVKQAAAYMNKTGITITKYFEYCRSSDKTVLKLLSKKFEDRHRYPSARNAVAATWLISFEHIQRDMPLAAEYLKFMSFLVEKDIPMSLLPPPPTDELEANEALGTLASYAFITRRGDNAFDMHRLVRLATQNWMEQNGELQGGIASASQRLANVIPEPEHANRDVWLQYLPHAVAVLGSTVESFEFTHNPGLVSRVADGIYLLGDYESARQLHEQASDTYTQILGVEHPATLLSLSKIAYLLRKLQRYQDSKMLSQQVLDISARIWGPEHPNTLESMGGLAIALYRLGRLAEAEALHREVLHKKTQILGAEHPSTLSSMDDLAMVLSDCNKYSEAELLCRQALDKGIRVLGAGHPEIIQRMWILAVTLEHLGKYEEAGELLLLVHAKSTQTLGVDHPDTLRSANNLARYRLRRSEEA